MPKLPFYCAFFHNIFVIKQLEDWGNISSTSLLIINMIKVNICYSEQQKIINNCFQATCFAVLISVAIAQGPGYGPEKEGPPKPYNYQYGVSDEYSKANFQKTESQDSNVKMPSYY